MTSFYDLNPLIGNALDALHAVAEWSAPVDAGLPHADKRENWERDLYSRVAGDKVSQAISALQDVQLLLAGLGLAERQATERQRAGV